MPRFPLPRPRFLAVFPALFALSLAASAPAMAQQPTVSIDDPSPEDEGHTIEFTVSLPSLPSQGLSVRYRTLAIAGEAKEEDGANCDETDYIASSGFISFNPASTSLTRTVHVGTCTDGLDEADEQFTVELYDENNVTVAKRVGTSRLIDVDSPPSLEIENATVTEPDTGATANATFDVSLSEPSGQDVTFTFAPSNLPAGASAGASCATPGVDFETPSGSRTIPAGALTPSVSVRVTVCGDLLDENEEQFRVKLLNVSNASGTPQATGKIIDDDPTPTLSINNVTVTESSNATFTVGLSARSGRPVTVNRSTVNGTADGGMCDEDADFRSSTPAPLTIPAGQPNKTFTVPVCDDRPDENTETFKVKLTNPSNATGTPQGTATITDNDPPPKLLVHSGLTRAEGDDGTTRHALPLVLVDPDDGHLVASGKPISFTVDTQDAAGATGQATCSTSGADYVKHVGSQVDIGSGANKGWIFLEVCGDTAVERSEPFRVVVSGVQNATPDPTPTAEFTIVNDDGPQLIIGSAAGAEGTMITFPVTLVGATSKSVRVDFETRDGTARSDASSSACGPGNDYRPEAGSVVFPASSAASQTRTIPVFACADGPMPPEAPERFSVRLSRPDFARITVGDATGVIV